MTTLVRSGDLDIAQATLQEIYLAEDTVLVSRMVEFLESAESLKAQFLVALGEFDARGLSESNGARTVAMYLTRMCGQSKRSAQEYRAVARKLREWPEVAMHYLAGRFTYSALRLVLRYVTEDTVEELVKLASTMTCVELEQLLKARDPNESPEREPKEYTRYRRCPESGFLYGSFALNPEHAAEFEAAMKLTELMQLRGLEDLNIPTGLSQEEILAYIEEQLVLAKTEAEAEEVEYQEEETTKPYLRELTEEDIFPPPQEEQKEDEKLPKTRFGPPLPSLLLGSLMTMIRSVLLNPRSAVRSPSAEVHIIVGVDGMARLAGTAPGTTNQLLNAIINGALKFHFQHDDGVTIETGSAKRHIPRALEIALLATWGFMCATPGCYHTRFLQFHHIVEYAAGGPTEIRNLLPLCSGCHAMVTAGLIQIVIDPHDPSRLHFRVPNGKQFVSYSRTLPQIAGHQEDIIEGELIDGDNFTD